MGSLIVKYTFSGTLHGISSITEIKDFLSHLSRSVSLAAVLINLHRLRSKIYLALCARCWAFAKAPVFRAGTKQVPWLIAYTKYRPLDDALRKYHFRFRLPTQL